MGSCGLKSGRDGEILILVNGVSYGLNSDRDVGGGASVEPHGPFLTLLRKQREFIDQTK